jgi:predicted metalloprotease with PDZ domain
MNGSIDFDLPKTVFSGAYKLKKIQYNVYDLGFTFNSKDNKLYTIAVNPLGPAHKAGIRNDMEIISSTSTGRFSNAWCDCPVKMVVLVNGERKTIEYFPKGKKVKILQYIKS